MVGPKSRYRYQLISNEKELIMLTFPRALYKILSSLSVKTQIAVCEDLIRTLNSKKEKKEGSKLRGNLATHFVDALEKNKNFNQIAIPMIKKSRTKSTNPIAIIMKNSGRLSFKTPEGENYEFDYVDHEIHYLRAASKKEQNVTASIDYIATAGSVPILGEIKWKIDQNPFYAFIQLLTYLSEFATPNQVQRCLKENLFKNGENQLAHFDLHIMLGNFNNKSKKFVLIEFTKKLATAFKKRLNNEHPKEAQLLNNIYCIHVKVEKPETSFSKLECLWVV